MKINAIEQFVRDEVRAKWKGQGDIDQFCREIATDVAVKVHGYASSVARTEVVLVRLEEEGFIS